MVARRSRNSVTVGLDSASVRPLVIPCAELDFGLPGPAGLRQQDAEVAVSDPRSLRYVVTAGLAATSSRSIDSAVRYSGSASRIRPVALSTMREIVMVQRQQPAEFGDGGVLRDQAPARSPGPRERGPPPPSAGPSAGAGCRG